MSGWRIAALVVASTVGVVVALLFAGSAHGLTLLAYVLFLGALAVTVLVAQLAALLPVAPPFEQLLARAPRSEAPVEQLETMQKIVTAAGWNQAELHYRLRPVVREVLAARLSRRHGIDPDREPERARAVVGDGRVWELARPDRDPPEDRYQRGWSRRDLEELLDELESV
jgi:hypothetical protein